MRESRQSWNHGRDWSLAAQGLVLGQRHHDTVHFAPTGNLIRGILSDNSILTQVASITRTTLTPTQILSRRCALHPVTSARSNWTLHTLRARRRHEHTRSHETVLSERV